MPRITEGSSPSPCRRRWNEQLRQVVEEEGRTVSELLREAFRLYLEEREWRRQERMERRRSRQTGQKETRRRNR